MYEHIYRLKETGCEYVEWIQLAQDRVQWGGSWEHYNKNSGSTKGGEFLD